MKAIKILLIVSLVFLKVTIGLGKVIPYTGYHIEVHGMGYFDMHWGAPFSDACETSFRNYYCNENLYAMAKPADFNTTVGNSSNISNYPTNIFVRNRREIWKRNTSVNCPPGEYQTLPFFYTNAPTTYYGIKVLLNGLIHYGWLRVSEGMYTAYIEDIPGFSIRVGDVVGFQETSMNYVKISGRIYIDNNTNNTYDAGDVAVTNQNVWLQNHMYGSTTGIDGRYEFFVPGALAGNQSIQLSYSTTYMSILPNNAKLSVAFPRSADLTNQDFIVDLRTTITQPVKVKIEEFKNRHRRCFKSGVKVNIINNSNVALTDVPISIEIPTYTEVLSSTPTYASLANKVAEYVIPSIAANSTYAISLVDSIVCGNEAIRGLTQTYRATVNIAYAGSDVFPYYECKNTHHLFKLVNKGNAEMGDSVSYKVYLNNLFAGTRKYKTVAQDTFYLEIPNDGRSVKLEVFQEASNQRTNVRTLIAEGCGYGVVWDKGFSDQVLIGDSVYYSGRLDFMIRDSYDPNEMIVRPVGWGANHNILPTQEITYHIGFQNTGSADAVSIVLVDTLSSALDASTMKMLTSTHANYKPSYTVLGNGKIRLSIVYAGINLPPSSVNEPGSHGYIEFTIQPKTSAALGTRLDNRAFIYFDYNSAIETNSVFQTLSVESPVLAGPGPGIRTTGATLSTSDQSLTYGDLATDPVFTTNAGAVGLNAVSLNPEIITFESGKLVIHKSGTATLNYTHAGNQNYLPVVGTQARTVTVQKAPLTIQATSAQRFVGETNPILTWTATGFVYNEDEAVLQGNPEITCAADETSAIATYPIEISTGTLSADNYNISYVNGTLHVVQITGINDWSASGIKVYPIPSRNGKLTVDVPYEELERITLTDVSGKSETFYQKEINSQLEGLLVMTIYTNKGKYSGKVQLTR